MTWGEPAAYAHRPARISWVLLAGALAFSSRSRCASRSSITAPSIAATSSVGRRLNARLAPAISHGVRAVVPTADGVRIADEDDPAAIHYAVEMRPYADESTLDRRLTVGAAAGSEVRDVARRLALPRRRRGPAGARAGGAGARGELDESFAALRALAVGPGRRTP